MARAGRKKTGGNRYENGRLKPKKRQEDVRSVAIAARKRVFGINSEEAMHTEAGYTLGRLLPQLIPNMHDGSKQAQQFLAAGNEFAETMRTFLLSAGLGSPTAVALDPNRVRGRGGDKPVQCQGRAKMYSDALREIDRINLQLVKCRMPSAHEIVWRVCVCEMDETLFPLTPAQLGVLREGLNQIHRLMGSQNIVAKAA